MRKITNIDLVYEQLSVSLALQVSAGTLSQVHNADLGVYTPDRTITPLTLVPKATVYDPSGSVTGDVAVSDVKWYELPESAQASGNTFLENELSAYLITSASSGYTIGTDGRLTVAKNISYLSPVALVMTCSYFDARSRLVYKMQGRVQLHTSSIGSPTTLEIDKNASWTFDPVVDTGTRSISAELRCGNSAVTTSVKYWWYTRSGSTDTLITEEDLFYVSGQNTAKLTIDPRYVNGQVKIVCKAQAYSGTAPSTPSSTAKEAETTVIRRYGDWDYQAVVNGSNQVSKDAVTIKCECIVTHNRKALTSASSFFKIVWLTKKSVWGSDWKQVGMGDEIDISATEMSSQGMQIAADVDEKESLKAMSLSGTVLSLNNAILIL